MKFVSARNIRSNFSMPKGFSCSLPKDGRGGHFYPAQLYQMSACPLESPLDLIGTRLRLERALYDPPVNSQSSSRCCRRERTGNESH
jgi:hypothetical protein